MAKPSSPSKTQQAVAANKAAQQARTQRVAETTKKLEQLKKPTESTTKPTTTTSTTSTGRPTGPAIATVSNEEAARRAAQEVENARIQTQRTDWVEYTTQMFNNYGLGTLAPKITEYVQQGFSPDTVTLKLQETPEYKQRFAGNESRRKSGLSVLSPKEYLATEDAYRQIMRSTGLPKGFYDSPDDFSKFIE